MENRIDQGAVQKEKRRVETRLREVENRKFNNVKQAFAGNPAPAPAQNVQGQPQNAQGQAQNQPNPQQNQAVHADENHVRRTQSFNGGRRRV